VQDLLEDLGVGHQSLARADRGLDESLRIHLAGRLMAGSQYTSSPWALASRAQSST
jgi:hypothetical protein